MLKKLIVAAQLTLSLQASAQAPVKGAAPVLPDHFIRVTIGDNEPAPETRSRTYRRPKAEDQVRDLKGRVRTLESAVRQLQEEIYDLRYAQRDQRDTTPQVIVTGTKNNRWFCSLTSDFDHTYTGRGDTETEARARSLSACQDKESGTFCSDKKVRCEEAR